MVLIEITVSGRSHYSATCDQDAEHRLMTHRLAGTKCSTREKLKRGRVDFASPIQGIKSVPAGDI